MAQSLLNARFLIQSVSGIGPYQASGLFYDNTNIWNASQVAINYEVFDFVANRWQITNIIAQVGSGLILELTDIDSNGVPPALGNANIYQPTPNFDLPVSSTEQNGVSEYLKEFTRNNALIKIDAAITGVQSSTDINTSTLAGVQAVTAQLSYSPTELITLTSTDILNGYATLQHTPNMSMGFELHVVGGVIQQYGVDYTILFNNQLTWEGDFGETLIAGDTLNVSYYY